MRRTLGAILIGGEGRRFGEAKDRAQLPDGTPFVARAFQALGPGCGAVVTVGGRPHGDRDGIPDTRPDAGPLGGLDAALQHAKAEDRPGVVILAVDLPRMSAPAVLELLRRWRATPGPEDSVVVATGPEGPQPLAAVWGVGAAPVVRAALDAGELRVLSVLHRLREAGLHVGEVPEAVLEATAGHGAPLLNLNRRDDLAAAVAPVCPPIVAVQGWKNSGKTTVAERLVAALVERGVRVMTLKRGHAFDLDHPGTDSHRLAEAGSERAVLVGPESLAVIGTRPAEVSDYAASLARLHLADAEVVVAEGWKQATLPAIEVRRTGARSTDPLGAEDRSDADRFLARVGDLATPDEGLDGIPAWTGDEVDLGGHLAELVLERVMGRGKAGR